MHSTLSFLSESLSQIGPPVDPRQIDVLYPTYIWWISLLPMIIITMVLRHTKKNIHRELLLLILIFFISSFPLFGMCFVTDSIIGAYPTIDKNGSLFFYSQGVHITSLLSPIEAMNHNGVQLIGFHMGHHWITQFFNYFFPLSIAYNIHILFNFLLSTISMWTLLWLQDAKPQKIWMRIGLSLLFGCGVHSYVDAQWYTIEKSALYTLPMFYICLVYIKKPLLTGIVFFLSAYINLYFAIMNGMFILIYLSFHREQWKQFIGISITAVIVLLYQSTLMKYSDTLATPEMYLEQRAAFDALHIFSLDWARIPLFLVINPVVLWVGFRSKGKHSWEISACLLFFLLSIGPYVYPNVWNPVYWLFTQKIPFMWRFSEPEIFFHFCLLILYTWTLRSDMSKREHLFLFSLYAAFQLYCIRLPLSQFLLH
jgi:hypothetical protein